MVAVVVTLGSLSSLGSARSRHSAYSSRNRLAGCGETIGERGVEGGERGVEGDMGGTQRSLKNVSSKSCSCCSFSLLSAGKALLAMSELKPTLITQPMSPSPC